MLGASSEQKMEQLMTYTVGVIFNNGTRKEGKITGDDLKTLLRTIFEEQYHSSDDVSEIDLIEIGPVIRGVRTRKIVARYLDSARATMASAPDGEWNFKNGHLFVDGRRFRPRQARYETSLN